jgi:hypothetical protein
MNRAEAATLLTLAAARDRRTIGDADVAAWAEDLADIAFVEARAALTRFFRTSTEWLKPAHIIELVKAIRVDAQRYDPHPIRSLPSRFEFDPDREARRIRGVAICRAELAEHGIGAVDPDEVLDPTSPARDRALRRARTDRATQEATR